MSSAASNNPGSNTLYYELVLEANDFMATLKTAEGQALSFDQTMAVMKEEIKTLMAEFGIDAPTAIRVLQQVRGELDLDAEALERLQNIARSGALQQVGTDLKESAYSGMTLESTLRMVEGVIVSMAVFQGIQLLSQGLADATKNATDYFQALQNITVAQSALAQQGMAVTNQQLLDIVNQLHDKWQTISQVDMTQAVSQAGLMASEYHLSVEQMTQLANEAAILHQLDPSKPMAEYVTQLAKALEGGRSLALNGEQIAITTEELKNKAVELGLVQEGSKAALTDQQKIVAGLAIEYERLSPEEAKLTQEIKDGNSSLVQQEVAQARMKDMTTSVGEVLKNQLAVLEDIGVSIAAVVLDVYRWWQGVDATIVRLAAASVPLQIIGALAYTVAQIFEGNVHSVQDFVNALKEGTGILQQMVDKMAQMAAIPDWRNLASSAQQQSGLNFGNTPVGPGQDVTGASSIDESKLQSILDSVAKDYQTYYDGVEKATEDFNLKMQNMQDEYNLRVQNEIENYDLKVANEKENFRLKELQQEQDFQQKMKDMTAQYLLDLEDALRKRDAEAVIKVIEKYNMEKTAAEQGEKLKQEQDRQAEALKLKQMKEEEQLRLKQMADEYALQKEEAQRAYQQQLADLAKALDTKLQEEAVKAQQDLGLNQSSIDAIYKLFTEYYGSNGKFAQMQQGAYTQMIQQSQGFVSQMAVIMQEYAAVLSTMGASAGTGFTGSFGEGQTSGGYGSPSTAPSGGGGGGGGKSNKMASGGVALAASATDVTFGEAGPELAMFLPLNSAGSPSFGGGGGLLGGGAGGFVTIALQMSQDFEARIVSTTLTHAALQIERVYRSH